MRRILITLLLTIYFPIITMAQFSPEPINGQCGDFAGTTFDVFPTQYDQASKLCAQGEFDQRLWTNIDNNNPNQIQNFSRLCKGINGGETVACNAKGDTHYYENNIAKSCGTAKTASFMTTASPIGIAYTNFQNKFLGNLCNQEIN